MPNQQLISSGLDLRQFISTYLKSWPITTALWRGAEFDAVRKLEITGPLLDMGCGDGFFSMYLFGKGLDAGVDLNSKEVETARKLGVYKEVYALDARKLPFPDGAFETVFSNCVMEHVVSLDEVLSEINRVLKPGGRFIFTTPSEMFNDMLFYPKLFKQLKLKFMADFYIRSLHKSMKHAQIGGVEFWEKSLNQAGLKLAGQHYLLGPQAMKVFDVTLSLGALSKVWRKLFNRWTIFPRFWYTWIWKKSLYDLIKEPSPPGGGLLLIGQKDVAGPAR